MKGSNGMLYKKSRNISRKHKVSMLTVNDIVKEFKVGERVVIVPKGNRNNIPHPRYKGRVGEIVEKRGSAYVVELKLSKSTSRRIISNAIDLEPLSRG
ncbi:MAG: hypothetical protein QXL16_00220 [Candidatus Micrarchaeaceae archaeon]